MLKGLLRKRAAFFIRRYGGAAGYTFSVNNQPVTGVFYESPKTVLLSGDK
jgi:hypothetical protein